ncbi:MAG: WG repeat-containing protein [Bacteroidota bacterium]
MKSLLPSTVVAFALVFLFDIHLGQAQQLKSHYHRKKRKYGIVNAKGKKITPHIYDEARIFLGGYAGVGKKKEKKRLSGVYDYSVGTAKYRSYDYETTGYKWKYGVIDSTGKVLIPLKYPEMVHVSYDGWASYYVNPPSPAEAPYTIRIKRLFNPFKIERREEHLEFITKNDKMGFKSNLRVLVPPRYDTIYSPWPVDYEEIDHGTSDEKVQDQDEREFLRQNRINGLSFIVQDGNHYGFYRGGILQIPVTYDSIQHRQNELILYKSGKEFRTSDFGVKIEKVRAFPYGKLVGDKFEHKLADGKYIKKEFNECGQLVHTMDTLGKVLLDSLGNVKGPFKDIKIMDCDKFLFKEGGKWGLYSGDVEILKPIYDEIKMLKGEKFLVREGDTWGLRNRDSEIIPMAYQELKVLGNGRVMIQKDHKWGLWNRNAVTVKPQYVELKQLVVGSKLYFVARVSEKEKKVGLVNDEGEELLPFEFKKIRYSQHEDYFIVSRYTDPDKDIVSFLFSKEGVVSLSKGQILPYEYEEIGPIYHNRIPAKIDELWGFLDLSGAWKIKPQYSSTNSKGFKEGTAWVTDARTKKLLKILPDGKKVK